MLLSYQHDQFVLVYLTLSCQRHVVNDVESCSEEWNVRSHRTTQNRIRVCKWFPDNYAQCTCKIAWHKYNSRKKNLCLCSILSARCRFEMEQNSNMSKTCFFFMRLTLLNYIIKLKNEISDAFKCIQTLDWGSVIFPHQYDNHVHHVSTFISASSPVPVSWHFPLTDFFFQHTGLSFLRHTNPGNAFQLVFKVRLNTPLNSTVQGSN